MPAAGSVAVAPLLRPTRKACLRLSPSGRRQGIGEPSLVGAAPAIANAICNATGARVRALPMTPERVLDGLEARS